GGEVRDHGRLVEVGGLGRRVDDDRTDPFGNQHGDIEGECGPRSDGGPEGEVAVALEARTVRRTGQHVDVGEQTDEGQLSEVGCQVSVGEFVECDLADHGG